MAALMNSLGIDRLPAEEQLRLVDEILASLEDLSDPALTETQRRELDRRVALVDEGKTTMSRWEDVEARILARLRG